MAGPVSAGDAHCSAWLARHLRSNFLFLALADSGFGANHISGVDLTFATYLAASSSSECQIQNSTGNLYLLVVLLILTFAKVATETGCEC